MEHQLAFTRFLNEHFAGVAMQLLTLLHAHPENPAAPISNAFAMELLCVGFLFGLFFLVRMGLSVEKPGTAQHMAEMYYEFVDGQGEQIIGHGFERFMPFVGALGLFILTCNLIGLIPGLESPTSYLVVPLGCAVTVFVYYHFNGLRAQGPLGYLKHFMGPVWWLSFLLFPIELVSHTSRILSLTVRLYANMLAGDLLTLVFFSLVPIGLPFVFLSLHFGVACIQAYLFMVLAIIYISQAVAHEEKVA